MVKNHIFCTDVCVVLTAEQNTMSCSVGVSALQHGLVLNHPLASLIQLVLILPSGLVFELRKN